MVRQSRPADTSTGCGCAVLFFFAVWLWTQIQPYLGSILVLALIIGGLTLLIWGLTKLSKEQAARQPNRRPLPLGAPRILQIEKASSLAERRTLIAREFCRLAEVSLAFDPVNARTWPPAHRLDALREEAQVLHAGAVDETIAYLPEGDDGALTDHDIAVAIKSLLIYLNTLAASRGPHGNPLDLAATRLIVREQTRLRTLLHEVYDLLIDD